MKNNEEIRGLSAVEIEKEIAKAENNLVEVSIKTEASQEKDLSKKGKQKKYIARLKTILSEKNKEAVTTAK